VGDTTATLSWTASHDDVAVAGYRLYRDGNLVKTTAATSVIDTGLTPSTTYTYRVSAFDYASNESNQSAPLDVTTTAPAPAFVQENFAAPQPSQSAASAAYDLAQTAGNTNVVAVGWNDTAASITSIGDDRGNSYHLAVATFRGNGMSQAIYYATGIAAAS